MFFDVLTLNYFDLPALRIRPPPVLEHVSAVKGWIGSRSRRKRSFNRAYARRRYVLNSNIDNDLEHMASTTLDHAGPEPCDGETTPVKVSCFCKR